LRLWYICRPSDTYGTWFHIAFQINSYSDESKNKRLTALFTLVEKTEFYSKFLKQRMVERQEEEARKLEERRKRYVSCWVECRSWILFAQTRVLSATHTLPPCTYI
jgi:hypothetical protein